MGILQINLLGTNFTIKSSKDEEYLQKLLGFYSRITADIENSSGLKDPTQIAIMSGIKLCDELYKEKELKVELENKNFSSIQVQHEDEINRRALDMIQKIDKVL